MFPWRGAPWRASNPDDGANVGASTSAFAADAANAADADAGPPPPTADAAGTSTSPRPNLASTKPLNASTHSTGSSSTALRPQLSVDKQFARLGSLGAASAKNAAAVATAAAAVARARAAAAADVGGDVLLSAGKAGVKVGGAGVGCLARCGAGFSDFFLRSSIVDMAVGVVLGFSFQALIEALVEAWLTPLLGAIFGATDWSALSFEINGSKFQYGAFINSLLTFILVVLSCYFLVVAPMERLMAIKNKKRFITKDCAFCIEEIPIGATRCKYCCADLPELTAEEAAKLAIVNPLALVGTAFDAAGNLAGGVAGGVAGVLPGQLGKGLGKSKKGKGGKAVGLSAGSAPAATAGAAAATDAADASPSRAADQVALDVLEGGGEGVVVGGSGAINNNAAGSSPASERLSRRRRRHLFGQRNVDRLTAQELVAQEMAEASALRAASHVVPGTGGWLSGSTHRPGSSRQLALSRAGGGGSSGDGGGTTSASDIEAFRRGGVSGGAPGGYTTATSGEGSSGLLGGGGGGGLTGESESSAAAPAPAAANRRRFF